MKKRALMALPKLTATDEMKQIAASDLPRKEKTTYGYVREVCEYYAYLRCITQDGILKVAFFLPEHLRLNGSNPAYEVYLDKEKRQFITYNSLTQKWCESKLDRLDWKRLYWYAKTSWVSEEDMTAVQTYLGSNKKAVDAILQFQRDVRDEQLEQRHRRETDPWDKDMEQVPELPKDWSRWVDMVSIAIRRPVKIAAGISPIEAVRFTGNQSGKTHTHKKNMRLNPLSMGIANFRRDRKKTISIVASLSLGGVILLVTASILLVRSPERIARQYFPDGDYKIYIHSEKTEYEVMSKGNPLNEALRQEVLAVDGVTDVIENRQAVHVRFENEESSSGGMCDLLSDRNRDKMEAALVSGTLPQDSHSIALDMDYAEDMIGVDVGSVIKLSIGDQEIPVTVSGLLINDGLKNGHGPLALDSTCMVATKELFQEAMPMIDCFDYSWSIVSDPQKAEQIENSLSAIISSNPDLDLDTIGIHKDYEEMENRVVFGGFQALSWLVFLFGVVNLINTTLSNQMSRKRENSVFRAIGLTRKQLCQMTIYEGICYAFSAALATLAVGLPIAVIFARKFSEMTFHVAMPYSFPFLQMGLFVLVLFGLEVILSFWTMRRQKNQSLVEEMRAME